MKLKPLSKKYEAEQLAVQALACFNSRMDELDNQFELDDEDRKILAEEIKNLPQDEQSFASYKNKLEVIWRHKNKETKSEFEKQVQAKIEEEVNKRLEKMGQSSASSSVEEILDKAKASQVEIPNNNEQSSKAPQSLVSKFASAFDKKNILIS
jgi:hypothetical protein